MPFEDLTQKHIDPKYTFPHPFAGAPFINHLLETNCLSQNSGQHPIGFKSDESYLFGCIKSHSYGEYIFDWAWADFYHQHHQNYYPKLVHYLPFTPVNAPKIWGHLDEAIVQEALQFYLEHPQLTGQHYLFTTGPENALLKNLGFTIQGSLQYHWRNCWDSFEHFLSDLRKSRRKMITKERKQIAQSNLRIVQNEGEQCTTEKLQLLYQMYLSTIDKKGAIPYLSETFFTKLTKNMKEHFLIIEAIDKDTTVAMALFFKGPQTLYGRYWGILPEFQESFPFLHFELCYYQGMEYCIKNNLEYFEAGAQGEHKLHRGFAPTIVTSAHHLKDAPFYNVVKKHLQQQNAGVQQLYQDLHGKLPYKHDTRIL